MARYFFIVNLLFFKIQNPPTTAKITRYKKNKNMTLATTFFASIQYKTWLSVFFSQRKKPKRTFKKNIFFIFYGSILAVFNVGRHWCQPKGGRDYIMGYHITHISLNNGGYSRWRRISISITKVVNKSNFFRAVHRLLFFPPSNPL